MSKKVIYVSYMYLSDRVSHDWCIDYLIAKGITVEFWDLIFLLREEFDEVGTKTTDYLRTFRTYSEVDAMLRLPENRDAYYVMLVNYDGRTADLYRLLSKYNARMLFFSWIAFPMGRVQKWRRLLPGFSNPLWLAKKTFYKAKAIIYRKLKLVKPFYIVFAAGRVLMTGNLYATKVIPINMNDYDHYKKVKTEGRRLVDGRYAVFLDVNLPYHSDHKLVGWQTVKPRDYYASLNRFFELLEVKYGIKVVIAAHPRADYSVEQFHGREAYRLRTPELVRDADFVIAHHSASLSYAVLNYKPLLFIYTNEMASLCRHTVMSYIYCFAKYLDAAICNIEKITRDDQIVIKEVNHKYYNDYKYSFLTTPESEYTTTQEIFWREINMNQKERGFERAID